MRLSELWPLQFLALFYTETVLARYLENYLSEIIDIFTTDEL